MMNYPFLVLIFLTGLSGIVAQVTLLRELLIAFGGNELAIGIILSNWVVSEAAGAFAGWFASSVIARRPKAGEATGGEMPEEAPSPSGRGQSQNRDCFAVRHNSWRIPRDDLIIFVSLQIIFFLSLFCALYLSRVFKGILGIGFGQAVGIEAVLISLVIVLAPAFCHGALFSSGCKIYSQARARSSAPISRVYVWEMLGTICGGLLLAYFFIPRMDPFRTVFILSSVVFLFCVIIVGAGLKPAPTAIIIFAVYLFAGYPLVGRLQQVSLAQQWRGYGLLESRNSVYGNISVTAQGDQRTFFYNGVPAIVAPYPDKQFSQDLARLPLLFSPHPRNILIIGSGAGGLISEMLKHGVSRIDYVEIDPALIAAVKKYPTALTRRELSDKRVKLQFCDGRFFVRTSRMQYDVILIGVSCPSDLSTNRLFTGEFFALAKKRLAEGGIFCYWLPGSSSYLSRELAVLNSVVFSGLSANYKFTRIIPGDYYNIFLGSGSFDMRDLSASEISRRISAQEIERGSLVDPYLDYLLSPQRQNNIALQLSKVTPRENSDLRPFAVFQMLIWSSKKFFSLPPPLVSLIERFDLPAAAGSVLIIFTALFMIYRRAKPDACLVYGLATTGFFGMLANLILMFAFQVFYGCVFYMLSVFIAVFMAGSAAGAIFATCRDRFETCPYKSSLRLFIWLEAAIIIFSLLLGVFLGASAHSARLFVPQFFILFFLSGFFMGMQFSLAALLYSGVKTGRAGEASGVLYAADLAGGWFAGVLGGVILLPVLGLFNSCLLLAILKCTSLFWFFLTKKAK